MGQNKRWPVALCHRRDQIEKDPEQDPDPGPQEAKILGCHEQSQTEMANGGRSWATLDKY